MGKYSRSMENRDSQILFMYQVYLLESTTQNRVYIGFSTNSQKRLRRRNREISGGAKRTIKGGPWKIVCVVEGFHSKVHALRF